MIRVSSTRLADASASCLSVTARSVVFFWSKLFCGRGAAARGRAAVERNGGRSNATPAY